MRSSGGKGDGHCIGGRGGRGDRDRKGRVRATNVSLQGGGVGDCGRCVSEPRSAHTEGASGQPPRGDVDCESLISRRTAGALLAHRQVQRKMMERAGGEEAGVIEERNGVSHTAEC